MLLYSKAKSLYRNVVSLNVNQFLGTQTNPPVDGNGGVFYQLACILSGNVAIKNILCYDFPNPFTLSLKYLHFLIYSIPQKTIYK